MFPTQHTNIFYRRERDVANEYGLEIPFLGSDEFGPVSLAAPRDFGCTFSCDHGMPVRVRGGQVSNCVSVQGRTFPKTNLEAVAWQIGSFRQGLLVCARQDDAIWAIICQAYAPGIQRSVTKLFPVLE